MCETPGTARGGTGEGSYLELGMIGSFEAGVPACRRCEEERAALDEMAAAQDLCHGQR